MFEGQHILSSGQFDKEGIMAIFERAGEMEKRSGGDLLRGRVLATLFYEPSTRTRFSFETAMLRLGGSVVSNADMMSTSSMKKRETLFDTGRVVSQMVDVIAMRHPHEGTVAECAKGSLVPVLNAGDGSGDHPTQGLLDLFTIWKEFGALDGLTIGMVGDLKHSRVLHSQCQLLKHFNIKLMLVSPGELGLPEEMRQELTRNGIVYEESDDVHALVPQMDVLSCTRLQEERFSSLEEAERFRGMLRVDRALMHLAKERMVVIHPLPRVDELSEELDDDPRARYFDQVKNGVAVRMALLTMVLGVNP